MNQSNVIAGYLFGAFLVFITIRGNLPKYLSFLVGSVEKEKTPVVDVSDTYGNTNNIDGVDMSNAMGF